MRAHHHTLTRTLRPIIALVVLAVFAWTVGRGDSVATAAGPSPHAGGAQIVRITTHAFDWDSAFIGAVAGVGISMLVVGAGLRITQHNTSATGRGTVGATNASAMRTAGRRHR